MALAENVRLAGSVQRPPAMLGLRVDARPLRASAVHAAEATSTRRSSAAPRSATPVGGGGGGGRSLARRVLVARLRDGLPPSPPPPTPSLSGGPRKSVAAALQAKRTLAEALAEAHAVGAAAEAAAEASSEAMPPTLPRSRRKSAAAGFEEAAQRQASSGDGDGDAGEASASTPASTLPRSRRKSTPTPALEAVSKGKGGQEAERFLSTIAARRKVSAGPTGKEAQRLAAGGGDDDQPPRRGRPRTTKAKAASAGTALAGSGVSVVAGARTPGIGDALLERQLAEVRTRRRSLSKETVYDATNKDAVRFALSTPPPFALGQEREEKVEAVRNPSLAPPAPSIPRAHTNLRIWVW
jgi:hypothetical protein